MWLNTASLYVKIEPFEAICVHSLLCFDTMDHPCSAVINHNITQPYMLLHQQCGLVLMQSAFLRSAEFCRVVVVYLAQPFMVFYSRFLF